MQLFGPSTSTLSVTNQTLVNKVGPSASAQPSAKIAGTNPAQTVGNLRLTELTTVTKGESAGFGMPNWNLGPGGGQNLLAFGHLWKLASGVLLTVYTRESAEASTDGNGSICYKTSSDYGASWSAETQVYLASANPSFPAMSDLTCWQNSRGRTFIWFNLQSVAGQVPGQLIWTDDPLATPGTWSAPITVVDSNFSFNFFAVVCNAIELANGTMLLFGYGLNTGDPQKSCTCLQSTDNGATWTRRSLMTNGPVLGIEYVEPCAIFRADGSILVSMRRNSNSTINFITSSDLGLTWSAVGANTVAGQGKPHMLRITNGTIVLTTRSAAASGASCLFVCRDTDGTLATSWGPEEDFDPRMSATGVLYRSYYAGLSEIAPNVIGCAFAGANGVSTQSDWSYTYFVDGNAPVPTGSAVHRDIFCNGLAVNRQSIITIPNGVNHIGNSATGTQIATAMNALIDLMTSSGIGLQHPETPGNLIGWYEPWRDPGQVIGTGAASLLDLSLAGVGNLVQATGAKKPLYETIPWLARGNGMLFANGTQSMATAAFTGKSPPFTIFWAGGLPADSGGSRKVFMISDGATTFGHVDVGSTGVFTLAGSLAVNAPAFSVYPQGLMILRAEFNGASSKLYRDGQLIASGTIGTLGTCTLLQLGDAATGQVSWNWHFSCFNAILSAAQAREVERYIAATFAVEAWNPR